MVKRANLTHIKQLSSSEKDELRLAVLCLRDGLKEQDSGRKVTLPVAMIAKYLGTTVYAVR